VDVRQEVLLAEGRIRSHIRETFLEHSTYLSDLGGANVYCKLENLQHTGSFKVRGALSKVLSLTDEESGRGVVAASTGNHGAAVAFALRKLRAPGTIFVPEDAVQSKVQAIRALGVEVRTFGRDSAETEVQARKYAADNGLTYVSPYNDPQVLGGQGTIGVELERQLAGSDAVFASLGGGGLISGIAGYLKSVRPGVEIIGCSPENSQVMIQSVKAGEVLVLPSLPTLSDGTAGGVEPGAITFDLCRELVDEYVTVTEDEIVDALRLFVQAHHMLIEGAAAVAVASYIKMRDRFVGKNIVIVICGANISPDVLKEIL
jgi:threonine dehydratase